MNQQLIARLRNGEIAAENNGTLEQLREVLKATFPYDLPANGNGKYFLSDAGTGYFWKTSDEPSIPAIPITDFFTPSIEDRAVELLRELVRTIPRKFLEDCINKDDWKKRCAERRAAMENAEQFLNELNKDK